MEHGYIREHEIISLYLMRKLDPAECAEFEEHLVGCPQCLDEVELADDFRATLRRVTATDAPRPSTGWLSQFSAMQQVAVFTAAVVFAVGLTALFFVWQGRRVADELEQVRNASAAWERRYNREQQARKTAESQLGQTLAQAAAPLFMLNLTRGAVADTTEPPNVVSISPTSKSIVLALEWQNNPDFQSYRAILTDISGRRIWSADHILPPSSNALAIALPGSLLSAGKYLLTVEGERQGSYPLVGRYSFRVLLSK